MSSKEKFIKEDIHRKRFKEEEIFLSTLANHDMVYDNSFMLQKPSHDS